MTSDHNVNQRAISTVSAQLGTLTYAPLELISRLKRDDKGAIILILGLTLPLIIAIVGLAIDVSSWYYAERRVQTATDSAAISGALTLFQTSSDLDAENSAIDSAGRNDFYAGTGRVLQYNSPPSSGAYSGDLSAVEIIATEDQVMYLADILYTGGATVHSRAVAAALVRTEIHCVLGLDQSMDGAVEFTGSADFDMGCGVASNSGSPKSMEIWGNAEVNATPMTSAGDIAIGGSATLEPANQLLYTWQLSVTDPYGPKGRDIQVPKFPIGCTYNNLKVTNTTMMLPEGRYCGGLKISNSDVTFLAGEHIMDGGDFEVSGTSTLTGVQVIFILTGSGSTYATVKFSGGTTADLTAPTSGQYEGVVFFGDPAAPSFKGKNMVSSDFLGGSDMNITGAIYDPAREIVFTGGLGLASNCLQLIGRKVTLTGSGAVANDCPADIDLAPILATHVKLVE